MIFSLVNLDNSTRAQWKFTLREEEQMMLARIICSSLSNGLVSHTE